MNAQIIAQLTLVAFLVEALWETSKMVWDGNKINIDKIGVLATGILVAILFNIDLFAQLGLTTTIPYVPLALSGILLSRGSNFVHDIFKKIQG